MTDPEVIIKAIDMYMDKMPDMESGNIQTRLDYQERITKGLVKLMKYEAVLHGDYKLKYQSRRIQEAKSILKSQESVSRAVAAAPYVCEDQRREEAKAEADLEEIRLYRRSVQHYIETTKQTNSFLKQELK